MYPLMEYVAVLPRYSVEAPYFRENEMCVGPKNEMCVCGPYQCIININVFDFKSP